MSKDTNKLCEKVSTLLKKHSKKWSRCLDNNPQFSECPPMKQQFMDLVSISSLLADSFDNARREIKRELTTITSLPQCQFKRDKQIARQNFNKADKEFKTLAEEQTKLQDQLNELNQQLKNTLLETLKETQLRSQKKSLKEQLQEKGIALQQARDVLNIEKQQYERRLDELLEANRRVEIDLLGKLNRYMQQYFAAMQVKLSPATMEKMNRTLQNESLIEEELHCLQTMCSQISFDSDSDNGSEDSSDTDDESFSSDSNVNNNKKNNTK
jgi:chromosome segregation ATPase